MATTTDGGTVTSFSNTTQAKDDSFSTALINGVSGSLITEDFAGIVYLDVMANDLGGNAKTLWSLDDGISSSTSTKLYAPTDLLTQDTARYESISTDTSYFGAKIWITSEGKVGYDASTLSATFREALQALSPGQTLSDSFTYSIRLGNGTLSWATAKIQFAGVNDAAVFTGTNTVTLSEGDTPQSTGGKLNATDVDSAATFVVQTDIAGSNGYGKFTIAADGSWTYVMDNAHDEFVGGQDYTDTITVSTADGTTQVLTVTMHGTNDAAVITGSSTAELTETNAAQSTGGDLNATDVDSPATFMPQTNVTGSNGYGKFTIAADGTWTYVMDNAHDEFVGGQDYIDSLTVATADGTTQVLTVTMHGTNDAAVITGSSTAELTETNAAQSTGGDLNATDVDSPATFMPQTNVAGSNGYGSFSIDASGAWTYQMNGAHNEFMGGIDYTDSLTVATADGTTQVLTVTMHGTNDAAVITGSSSASLTETDAAQSTGGTLSATDVDSSAAFVVQANVAGSNGYGSFSIAANGAWTYQMNGAHNEFVGGVDYTDSLTVATADGTTQVLTVTMHGTNDAAVITGSSTAELTETNAAQSTGGDLNATDVDSPATFMPQTNVAGSNGYGSFSIDASGAWTYQMNGAHNEFMGGIDYTDSLTVATADGTTQVLTVTMHGTNDAAVITGSSTASLTETNAAQSTAGDLNATDVDSSAAFEPQTDVAGSNGYGSFSIDASGAWTYQMNGAHNEFVGGVDYTDSLTVATADGTTQVLTVTMHGTNDAAVITGSSSASLTETDAAQSTGGTLSATDVDSSAAFVVQTNVVGSNGYGSFSIAANGAWTYQMNGAHNEFVGGQDYTDSLTVATADGTTQVLTVTMHGTNDAAVITGSSTAELTETNAAQSTGGTLTSDDVDNPDNAFTAGSIMGAIGTFSIDAAGAWAFTANSAFNQLNVGDSVTETYNVTSIDGTPSTVQITINGTNDVPTIAGASAGSVQEDTNVVGGQLIASGSLTIVDVDSGQSSFRPQASVAGTYGTFTLTAAGAWTYSVNNSLAAIQALNAGQSLSDSFQAVSQDGSAAQLVSVTIQGLNDTTSLSGTTGKDIYSFSATGSGAYTITDPGSTNDTIQITGVDSKLSTLNFEKLGSNLLIEIGDQDITVLNHYSASGNAIESITFDVGQSYFGYALSGTYNIQTGSNFDAGNGGSNDVVAGTSGSQTIDGGGGASGRDLLFGNAGNDTLSGQNDDDLLIGGGGNDILNGNDGNDLLIGGTGNDSLTGGAGADRFVFAEVGTLNLDSVLDYSFSQGDTLDLSTLLDANFTNTSQVSDFVKLTQTGTNVTVQVDTDGSAGGANFVDVASLTNYGTSGSDVVKILFEGSDHLLSI